VISNEISCQQSQSKTLTFDFEKMKFEDLLNIDYNDLKYGDNIKVKVINYNPILYNIVVTADDSVILPKVASDNLITKFIGLDGTLGVVKGLVTMIANADPKVSKNTTKKENSANQSIASYEGNKIPKLEAIDTIKTLNELYTLIQEINTYIQTTQIQMTRQMYSLKLNKSPINPDSFTQQLSDYNKKLLEFKVKSNCQNRTTPIIDSALGVLQNGAIDALIASLYRLNIYSSEYTTPPLYYTEDFKKITIQFQRKIDSNLPIYPPCVIKLPFHNRTKFGISAGLYSSLGLYSNQYSYTFNSTDSSYQLLENKGSSFEIGINALAYHGWHIGSNNYLGGTVGAGMSIESSPKPRIFIGGMWLSGRNNSFSLSLGLVLGYVNKLSDNFTVNEKYKTAEMNHLKSVLNTGAFLSVNYSIF